MDLVNAFWAGPPVTRTLAAAIFIESILALAGIVSPYRLVFSWYFIWKPFPEIWRFASCFCLAQKLEILFNPYFVWTYGGSLETESSRFDSARFLVYLVFVGFAIIGFDTLLFGSLIFLQPLLIAIVYTNSQENRGKIVNFFFINVDAKYLAYLMLLVDLVQGGPVSALRGAVGIPAAHLYDFLTIYWPQYGRGPSLLQTPAFVQQWFANETGTHNVTVKGHGTAYTPASARATTTSSSWGSRGAGRRLGGD